MGTCISVNTLHSIKLLIFYIYFVLLYSFFTFQGAVGFHHVLHGHVVASSQRDMFGYVSPESVHEEDIPEVGSIRQSDCLWTA